MRINPSTGKIVSNQDHFCPNCDAELEDNYPYCDNCGEYVGLLTGYGGGYSGHTSNKKNSTNDIEQYRKDADKEFNQICCCVF